MTNLQWLLSMSVEDMEKMYHGDPCDVCAYKPNGYNVCNRNLSCVEGQLKWLNAKHVPEIKPRSLAL